MAGTPGNDERILLVEDEDAIHKGTSRLLTSSGYLVFAAASAKEALSIFDPEDGSFQLAFSDAVLPAKSGVELGGQLLVLKPEIGTVLSSGYAGGKSQWSEIGEKGYPVIYKPYTAEKALHSIKENRRNYMSARRKASS